MNKKPTSVRLDSEIKAKLDALAKRDNLTASQIINKAINEYSGKTTNQQENPTTEKKLNALEQEVSMQRQRINILKNQIDYILKSIDGNKHNRPPKDYQSKQSLENE